MTATVDVIIPYYRDTPGREELMNYTRKLWEDRYGQSYGAVAYISGDGGPGRPFSRGKARNAATVGAVGEWLALWDTDVPPPSERRLADAIRVAQRFGWSPVWSRTVTFTPVGTRRVLDAAAAGEPYELADGDMQNLLPMCKGPTVVRRRVFDTIGGYDERFTGWGYEDSALRNVLTAMYGRPPEFPADEICWSLSLDEEDPHKRTEMVANKELYMREYANLDRGTALDLISRLRAQRVKSEAAEPAAPKRQSRDGGASSEQRSTSRTAGRRAPRKRASQEAGPKPSRSTRGTTSDSSP